MSERRIILGGLIWKFLEKISSQGVSFVLSIILARILLPEQYGVIAMVSVFISLANIFLTSGLNTALIQKKDADEIDFSTIFYCNFMLSILLYGLLYLFAPYIALFYNMPELCEITRVYSLVLILGAYSSIQSAYISRHMMFRKAFFVSIFSTTVSGLLGIIMAYNGYGVWALITQYISSVFFSILVQCIIVGWYPKLLFSIKRAKELTRYGLGVLGAAFVGEAFLELRQLLIGKYYPPADLAQYNRGKTFPHLVSSNIEHTIGAVLFPAMSNHSNNPEEIKKITRRSMKISSYLMFFMLTMLAVVAHPLVNILLTEKWLPCVPYMQLMCISGMITIVSTANMQAIKAIGRSDIVFKLELYKKPIFLLLLVVAVKISVLAVAITLPLYALYGTCINMSPNHKLLNYSYQEQMIDILPQFLLAVVMFLAVWPISLLGWNDWLTLPTQLVIGFVLYLLGSFLFHLEPLYYCKDQFLSLISNKK